MLNRNRALLAINAIVASAGVLLGLTLMATGYYVGNANPEKPTLLGNLPTGVDQVWERFFDWITYFTNLSNLVVALVLWLLVLKPDLLFSAGNKGRWMRALRVDSVLMITVTGIVYNLLLASGPKTGADAVSNALLHNITPLLTVAVWLIAGPRGAIKLSTIFRSLALPTAWAVFALVRGEIIGAYPYPFFDVSAHGLVSVILFIVQILIFAMLIALAMLGIDKATNRAK